MLVEVAIMSKTYTHSTWRVKPGLEDEFVRRWEELADWSGWQGLTARAKLLRDTDDPSRFVSFGPWGSIDAVWRWRGAPGFHERIARLQEVLDDFDPRTLELVSER
jgi:heme-degrading monooxygenase HmoA